MTLMAFLVGLTAGLLAVPHETAQPARPPRANDAAAASRPSSETVSPTSGPRHALLIGCTRYPELPISLQLRGPANDVQLMRRLLIDRFDFTEADIVMLLEGAAGDQLLPTRANISREFHRLAEISKPGDEVVIFMAGHGSQQPQADSPDPEDYKPDGMDEVFLPRDVGPWDGGKSKIENAIVDHELRAWLRAIQEKKPSIWIMIDACHSSTMIRDASDEVPRQVPPDVLVPRKDLDLARQRTLPREDSNRGSAPRTCLALDEPGHGDNIVALYAAQSNEPTVEKLLPPEADERKPYGLLTYAVCQTITQAKSPITYRELVQSVHEQYTRWGRSYPTPVLEGRDCDREILGKKACKNRPHILLSQNEKQEWTINAGTIQGMTPGSVLAVYPPAGKSDNAKPIAHVRIVATRPLDATVAPTQMPEADAKALPPSGRCRLVHLDYGDMRVRIAMAPGPSAQEGLSLASHQQVLKSLAQLTRRDGALVDLAKDHGRAQWLIRVQGNQAYLLPSNGWIDSGLPTSKTTRYPAVRQLFGPAPVDEGLAEWLQDRLQRVARVQNLLTLAGADKMIESPPGGVDVVVEMLRYAPVNPTKFDVVRWQNGRAVREGDIVGFRVRNRARDAVDVTLLFVDSNYGITPFFPRPGCEGDGRLGPGLDLFTRKARVTRSDAAEHMVAIAVRAEPQRMPVDFSCLCQPSIEKAQATRGAVQDLDTPLGRLFKNALFARGGTRGLDCTSIDRHAVRVLSWKVLDAQ